MARISVCNARAYVAYGGLSCWLLYPPHLLHYNERVRIGLRQARMSCYATICAGRAGASPAFAGTDLENRKRWGNSSFADHFEYGTLSCDAVLHGSGSRGIILEVGLGGAGCGSY